MKNNRKALINHKLFLIISSISIFLTFIVMVINHNNKTWDSIIFVNGNDLFMDFYNHIKYCENLKKTYFINYNACFPPLIYCFYHILSKLLSTDQITMFDSFSTGHYAYLLITIRFMIITVFYCYICNVFLNKYSRKYMTLFEICVLLSYPFIAGNIERANSSFVVCIMLGISIICKQSANKSLNELALLIISVCASFKIYPAIFGLLYINKKDKNKAIRLIIYGIFFFFMPFMFLGGKDGFIQFLQNQSIVQNSGKETLSPSLYVILYKMLKILEFSDSITNFIIIVSYICFIVTILVLFYKTNKLYIKLVYIVSFMVMLPLWSQCYTIGYFLIPLLQYLKEEKSIHFFDISFALIFSLFAFINIDNISNVVSITGCYLTLFFSIYKSIQLLSKDNILD